LCCSKSAFKKYYCYRYCIYEIQILKKFVPDTQANAAHNSCLEGLASLVESVVAQHGEDTTTTTEPIFFSNMRLDQLTQAEKVRRKQFFGSVRFSSFWAIRIR
jgi:hypothetical protein